jgi:osmotically inducible protein OsmC
MATERTATAVWHGDLMGGSGDVSTGSGVLQDQPVDWKARTEESGGKTSPEDLLAAAHAACYAMAFSNVLAQQGHAPDELRVTATVGFGPKQGGGGMAVQYSNLSVTGKVSGMDEAAFEDAARQGEQGCPISNALRNNVPIHLTAKLAAE